MEREINEYIKEIEQIAAKCTESQSDGYSQIMRICDEMREQQKYCLRYISKEEIEREMNIIDEINNTYLKAFGRRLF